MKIYLNNAATSYPKPPCVISAMAECLKQPPGDAHRGGLSKRDRFEETRERLALLLGGAEPKQIALTANATQGLNMALFGFPFRQGDVVLTTMAEHNAVLRPLYQLEKQRIVKNIFLKTDEAGRVDPRQWERAVETYRPRLCVFTHASNVTGAINDAKDMAFAAKKRGASVLLDASQTLGLTQLNAKEWGLDMVAFTGHKYLLGPQGTGGLYVSPEIRLTPHFVGGTGVRSDELEMPENIPLHLEAGTPNEAAAAGLCAALDWRIEHPADESAQDELFSHMIEGLTRAGASVISVEKPRTPVLSFTLPGWDCGDVGDILDESFDIVCRTGLHCAPKVHAFLPSGKSGTIRVSLSRFTTKEEIDALVSAVKEIADETKF